MGDRDVDTSVILTCFNERAYIGAALQSVLEQTATGRLREIIVVDDGSTDGSAELVEQIAANEPKITLLRTTGGGGVAAARNLALSRVQGPYVAFLDGDDQWRPDKLELQLPVLDDRPGVGLVYSDFYEFDDATPEKLARVHARAYAADHDNLLADYYLFDAPVMPSSMVVRKAVFDDIGVFNCDLRVGEDTEICLRIAEKCAFHHIGEPLVKKRLHARSLSSRQDRLWPNQVLVTRQFAERNPELKPLAAKRLARCAAKVAWGLIRVGDRRGAAPYLFRALRHNPYNARIYAYVALACVPQFMALRVHRLVGRARSPTRASPAS